MERLLIGLVVGAVAGVIDIAPMLATRAKRREVLTAFTHWLVIGVLIGYVDFGYAPWLDGMLTAVLVTLPVLVMLFREKPKSLVPILAMSVVLGALSGYAESALG